MIVIGIAGQCHPVPSKMSGLCFGLAEVEFPFFFFSIEKHCINFDRYQFLVYNASVVYFSYVRPFFRDGYRKHLCASFQHVVDVLMSIPDEQDFLWQAELLL